MSLTTEQARAYHEVGIIFPLRALDESRAATLVRGRDKGHFELEPAPESEFSDAAKLATQS